MPTDTERREVARRLREVQADVIPGAKTEVHPIAGRIIGVACGYDLPDFQGLLGRLADLIEPTDGFDLDTVQRVCFECMEGCDESEWTLMGRRTPKACASRAKRLGVRSRLNRGRAREWTPEEDRWCVMQLAVMCRTVRRSPQAVCAHLMYLSGKAKREAS